MLPILLLALLFVPPVVLGTELTIWLMSRVEHRPELKRILHPVRVVVYSLTVVALGMSASFHETTIHMLAILIVAGPFLAFVVSAIYAFKNTYHP